MSAPDRATGRDSAAVCAGGDTSGLKLPDFLIIGAMKAGSTSLARYFMAHPQVFMAPGKEVHYFDRHFEKGVEWYAQHFKDAPSDMPVGEATPNYLYSRDAIRHVASTLPDAKLIAILRNPVDRAYSHYWHERARGRETLEFEEAIEAEPERLASTEVEVRTHFSYLDQGLYVDQLMHLAQHFPRKALLVLLFDDLCAEPVATFRTVCRFVGVSDEYIPENLGKQFNAYVSFRSLKVRWLARALSSRRHALRFLGRVVGRLNTRRISYPPMRPNLRAKLARYYKEPNLALSSWLGRDLSQWD